MIWLTGAKGMLGTDTAASLKKAGLENISTDAEIDICDIDTIQEFCKGRTIQWIVNCAAYTSVNQAEEDEETAFHINAKGVKNLALCAEEIAAGLIHISTDFVFNGNSNGPYTEDSPVDPIGVYGKSKAAGELEVKKNTSRYYILRTSWLYGLHGNNFVSTILKQSAERSELSVVADQQGSPTYTRDLSETIVSLINHEKDAYGIYHYSNDGQTTWYDFATEIYRLARELNIHHNKCNIKAISTDAYQSKAKRPANSLLSKEKIKRVFGITIPHWKISLRRYCEKYLMYQLKNQEV